jgi:hypothetical protein
MVGLGCVIGLTAVVVIARALRARSTLSENRMMRDYLRRVASHRNQISETRAWLRRAVEQSHPGDLRARRRISSETDAFTDPE